ncbi:sulfotransferase [Limibacillus sp. MBR-115]|jgi:tetratricopeptide (TPR) repeat protein|uniref:tetratricopeptide repeat-containing sulfotransferase family protein n=1 Tax=Limibacillus sp. MBR-115 TaxID=3156465 RepID=UPI0033943305
MMNQSKIGTLLQKGAALQRAGDLKKAEGFYRQVLKLDRRNPDALHLLGTVLHLTGRSKQGLKVLEEAVAVQASNAAFRRSLAQILLALDQTGKARVQLEKAIALDPNFVAARANLGELLGKSGEHEEAVRQFRSALEHFPAHPALNNNLGNSLLKLQKFQEAHDAFTTALQGDPSLATAWEGLADVLVELDQDEAAWRLLKEAVARFGDNPRLLTKCGGLAQQFGAFEEAGTLLRKALAIDPHTYPAINRIAHIQKFKADDPLLKEMHRLWQDARPEGDDRHALAFALGKAEADCGNYDSAFAFYAEGNRLRRPEYQYDRNEARAENEDLIARYDAALFKAKQGIGAMDRRPVFVVGMPRSGTTLTEQILAAHPSVVGVGEARAMSRIAKHAPQDPLTLVAQEAEALGAAYLDHVVAMAGPEAERIIDKMPHNFQRLGLIALVLPGARIIHCRRDPADTCLSIFFQSFGGYLPFAYDLEELGAAYQDYRRLMAHWKNVLPLPMFDLDYEALVEDTEREARRLLSFLDLPWDPAVLSHHEASHEVKTASHWQVRQPVYQSSLGRWKRYEKHLGPLLPYLETLEEA